MQTIQESVNHQSGFSMVEVLVAMVVLSVGLLGMAGIYVTTLRSGSSAIYRMQAVNLAADLGERIRANRKSVALYAGAAATSPSCITAACLPDAMAANDLYIWQQQISQLLPGNPAGTVNVDTSTTPNTVTITVSWTDPGATAASSYSMVMQQ